MKIIMVMLMSVDGKITRGEDADIYKWTSKEDQKYFFSLIKKNALIVMGRKTYEASRERLRLEDNKLRVILTRYRERYRKYQVPEKLEFSSEPPAVLVARLKREGFKQILLVGGGEVNSSFLKDKLVDEIYLTIEPVLFGRGRPLIGEMPLDSRLTLMSTKKLNSKGTLLLKYKVDRKVA